MQRFEGSRNNLIGNIPPGITRYLAYLDLSYNKLNGSIPQVLLLYGNLHYVDLSYNALEGSIPENISSSFIVLNLGGNLLSGQLASVAFENLVNINFLELQDNWLTGPIPPKLGLCRSLTLLNLAQNRLTGILPRELGNLTNLEHMMLEQNGLFGIIPGEYSGLKNLQTMNISWNSVNGSFPYSISRLKNLRKLDLRGNILSGSIPNSIGSLSSLFELQLGDNQLGGNIPEMPNSLHLVLNLSNNLFEGPIPVSLSGLTALEVLDLSNNKFSGSIPDFLTKLASLTLLLLSNNELSGVVPDFRSHVTVVTNGNSNLISIKPAESSNQEFSEESTDRVLIISICSGFILGLILVKVIPYVPSYTPRIKCHWIIDDSIQKSNLNFSKAMEAVNQPSNIVFKSEFNTYYKASMPCGMNYCIKKLSWNSKTFTLLSSKEFARKIEALGHLNNPNIMSPLAYAFTIHSALVIYEWPHHGTLFDLLHGTDENVLIWEDRYKIAVGIASGLAFVHCFCSTDAPLVLLHLSTRSIFMKSMSEPLIGDFELHRVINPSKSLGTISVVAGAVGYVPPEYAYTMRVTTSGNIYSFGTILLELLTGKQAINEGMELVKWVVNKSLQQEQFEQILDHTVSTSSAEVHYQMLSVLGIALRCVSESIEERPDATQLHGMLLYRPQ